MGAIDASTLLRTGLLEDRSVLLAGSAQDAADDASVLGSVRAAFVGLGARAWPCELIAGGAPTGEVDIDNVVASVLERDGHLGMLVVDGGGVFAGAGAGRDALRACVEAAWNVTRAVVTAAYMPHGEGGRVMYIAPAPGAGAHAGAARAGLENLARTLSIEWARHGVTTVAIGPGDDTAACELAALTAYLASDAGAYFSGCLLDLSGPGSTL